jgi:hypothetical protein
VRVVLVDVSPDGVPDLAWRAAKPAAARLRVDVAEDRFAELEVVSDHRDGEVGVPAVRRYGAHDVFAEVPDTLLECRRAAVAVAARRRVGLAMVEELVEGRAQVHHQLLEVLVIVTVVIALECEASAVAVFCREHDEPCVMDGAERGEPVPDAGAAIGAGAREQLVERVLVVFLDRNDERGRARVRYCEHSPIPG